MEPSHMHPPKKMADQVKGLCPVTSVKPFFLFKSNSSTPDDRTPHHTSGLLPFTFQIIPIPLTGCNANCVDFNIHQTPRLAVLRKESLIRLVLLLASVLSSCHVCFYGGRSIFHYSVPPINADCET